MVKLEREISQENQYQNGMEEEWAPQPFTICSSSRTLQRLGWRVKLCRRAEYGLHRNRNAKKA